MKRRRYGEGTAKVRSRPCFYVPDRRGIRNTQLEPNGDEPSQGEFAPHSQGDVACVQEY